MLECASRFVQSLDGYIVDTINRFPSTPFVRPDGNRDSIQGNLADQVQLRKLVLRARLAVSGERVESLTHPEAHSLAHVVYWTIQASRVDLTIGQTARENCPVAKPSGSYLELGVLEPFFGDVAEMLRDLYSDCDQALLDKVLDEIHAVLGHWDRARTAMARSFFARLAGEPMKSSSGGRHAPKGGATPGGDRNADKDVASAPGMGVE
jgi:hypothetical protein